jgi:hypothetical protein
VEFTLGRVEEELSQQVSPWREVWGQRTSESVGCQAVQAPTSDKGRHRQLVDETGDLHADLFVARVDAPVVAGEFVKM